MSKETFGPLERLENCPKLQEAVCLKEQDIQNPDDSRLLHSYKPEIQPLNWTLQDVTEDILLIWHRSKLYLLLKLSLRGAANQTKAVYHVSLHFWEWKEERHKDPVLTTSSSPTLKVTVLLLRGTTTVNMVFFIRAKTKLVLKSMNSSTSWSADLQPTTTSSADLCIFYWLDRSNGPSTLSSDNLIHHIYNPYFLLGTF